MYLRKNTTTPSAVASGQFSLSKHDRHVKDDTACKVNMITLTAFLFAILKNNFLPVNLSTKKKGPSSTVVIYLLMIQRIFSLAQARSLQNLEKAYSRCFAEDGGETDNTVFCKDSFVVLFIKAIVCCLLNDHCRRGFLFIRFL